MCKAGDRYEKKEHNARPQREQLPIKYKGQGTHHLLSSNLILRGQQLLLPEYWAAPNIRKTSFYEPSTPGPIAYCQLLYRSDAGFRPIIGYTSTISIAYPFWLVNTSRFWSMIISIESEEFEVMYPYGWEIKWILRGSFNKAFKNHYEYCTSIWTWVLKKKLKTEKEYCSIHIFNVLLAT